MENTTFTNPFVPITVAMGYFEDAHGHWSAKGVTIISHMTDGSLQIITTADIGNLFKAEINHKIVNRGTFGDNGRRFEVRP